MAKDTTTDPAKAAADAAKANMRKLLGTPDADTTSSGEAPSLVANMRKLIRQGS